MTLRGPKAENCSCINYTKRKYDYMLGKGEYIKKKVLT